MNPFKACAIAFFRFSAIPMPAFEWREADQRYSYIFFPAVGLVITGAVKVIWMLQSVIGKGGLIPAVLLIAVVPIIITGGIHLDGYMDVSDAMSSWASREKRMAILKDPHIGAFAVIHLLKITLIGLAALYIIVSKGMSPSVVSLSFVISRAMSVVGLLTLKKAKKEGSLYETSSEADEVRKTNIAAAMLWIAGAFCMMAAFLSLMAGLLAAAAAALSFIWYRYMAYRNFDGITGDLAGYFVVICELNMIIAIAVAAII